MKSPQQIKLDLAKKRRAVSKERHEASLEATQELLTEIRSLHTMLNDNKPFDGSVLVEQLENIANSIDISEQLENLAKQLPSEQKPQEIDLTPLVDAIEANQPVVNIDLEEMSKAIIEIRQRVEENIVPAPEPGQLPEDYRPYRRVIKAGNRLIFDDNITSASRGGGGGSSRATPYENASGIPQFVTLVNGAIPTTSPILLSKIDTATTAGVTYIGKAAPGSSAASAVWQIKKLDTNTLALDKTWADGGAFTQIWDNRATTVVYS